MEFSNSNGSSKTHESNDSYLTASTVSDYVNESTSYNLNGDFGLQYKSKPSSRKRPKGELLSNESHSHPQDAKIHRLSSISSIKSEKNFHGEIYNQQQMESAVNSPPNKPRRIRHAKVTEEDFSRKCVVCHDKAYNYNYGCICCESCKMFFRRNSWKSQSLVCVQNNLGHCEVNVDKRRTCAACRLKKCLNSGMIRELNSYEFTIQQCSSNDNNTLAASTTTSSSTCSSDNSLKVPPPQNTINNNSSNSSNALVSLKYSWESQQQQSLSSATLRDTTLHLPQMDLVKQSFLRKKAENGDLYENVYSRSNYLTFTSKFASFKTQFKRPTNDLLETFLEKINQHFLTKNDASSSSLSPPRPSTSQHLAMTTTTPSSSKQSIGNFDLPMDLYSPSLHRCLFTEEEMTHVTQLGDSYFHHICKSPFPVSLRVNLVVPQFSNLLDAAEDFAKRIVLFAKTLPMFKQLSLSLQKSLITTRISMLINLSMMWFYNPEDRLYHFPLEDDTIFSVDVLKSVARSFREFPDMIYQDDVLSEYYRLLGRSKIGIALIAALKLFEVQHDHVKILDPYLFTVCQDAFHFYGCLLFKFLWLHYGPEEILSRWQHFCDSFRFSRNIFDVTAVRVVLHGTEEPCSSELMVELSQNLQQISTGVAPLPMELDDDHIPNFIDDSGHHLSSPSTPTSSTYVATS